MVLFTTEASAAYKVAHHALLRALPPQVSGGLIGTEEAAGRAAVGHLKPKTGPLQSLHS